MLKETLLLAAVKEFYKVEDSTHIKRDLTQMLYLFAIMPDGSNKPKPDELLSLKLTISFLEKLDEINSTDEAPL